VERKAAVFLNPTLKMNNGKRKRKRGEGRSSGNGGEEKEDGDRVELERMLRRVLDSLEDQLPINVQNIPIVVRRNLKKSIDGDYLSPLPQTINGLVLKELGDDNTHSGEMVAQMLVDQIQSAEEDYQDIVQIGKNGYLIFTLTSSNNDHERTSYDQNGTHEEEEAKDEGENMVEEIEEELIHHELTIETVPAEATQERFELYKKYQVEVHNDKPEDMSIEGFERFLVTSPLLMSSEDEREGRNERSTPRPKCGTYHQLYRFQYIYFGNCNFFGVLY